jgi:hypothetical protein
MAADFADNRPIVGTELGQWLGQPKRLQMRPHHVKVRRGNDLVDFEPFVRSKTLYPAELRARSKHFTVSSLRQVLLRFQPRVLAHSGHL